MSKETKDIKQFQRYNNNIKLNSNLDTESVRFSKNGPLTAKEKKDIDFRGEESSSKVTPSQLALTHRDSNISRQNRTISMKHKLDKSMLSNDRSNDQVSSKFISKEANRRSTEVNQHTQDPYSRRNEFMQDSDTTP